VVRVTIQQLSDKRSTSRGPQRKGVMLAWPENGSSILIVLADRREMKTSAVERVLASGALAVFAKTRNSTYRITCEPGDELSWHRLRGDAIPIAVPADDNDTSPEFVSDSEAKQSSPSGGTPRKRKR
jgi:hypothetical protein